MICVFFSRDTLQGTRYRSADHWGSFPVVALSDVNFSTLFLFSSASAVYRHAYNG